MNSFSSSLAAATLVAMASQAQASGSASGTNYPMGQNNIDWTISASETYDSNAARSTATEAESRGLVLGDSIGNASLNVDFLHAFGRQSVFLTGDAGYKFYNRNSVLNHQDIDLQGGGVGRVGSCELVVSDAVTSAQTSLDLLVNSVVSNVQTDNIVRASADCQRRVGFSPLASVSEAIIRNSASQLHGQDADTVSGSIGFAYDRPVLGRVSVYENLAHTDYTGLSPLAALLKIRPNYDVTSTMLTYTRPVGARLQLDASVGYSEVTQNFVSQTKFHGVTYNTGMTYAPNSRITANFQAQRAVKPSIQLGSTYQINDELDGLVSYKLSSRWLFSTGATNIHTTFNQASVGPTLLISSQTVNSVFATAEFTFHRVNALKLELREAERHSNAAAFNYSGNQISLTYTRHN